MKDNKPNSICPRCKQNSLDPVLTRNSLSHYDSIYICNDCGLEESFIDSGLIVMNETHKKFLRKIKKSKRTKPIDRPEAIPMRKRREIDDPYEIWQSADGQWEWRVLKKWTLYDHKPNARWFCAVTSPFIAPRYEYGDVYAEEIMSVARRIK